jgi:TetR/AcrR family transcriptional regulator, transcriptional repressor for nem operon
LLFITQVIKHVKMREVIKSTEMRVSKEQAAENRQKILAAATRLFRERGISATGVDAITEEAGLTHGAVYSQFGSKEAIVAEAVREAQAGSRRLWRRLADRNGANQAFTAIVAQYLSPAHRDAAGRGCLVAALASEIARQPERVRDAFTSELEKGLKYLAEVMKGDEASQHSDEAIEAFATMAGALILARAINDENLSNRILEVAAKRVIRLAGSGEASDLPRRTSARAKSSRHAK